MEKRTFINNGSEIRQIEGINILSINSKNSLHNQLKNRKLPLLKYCGFNALELMLVLAVIAVGIGVAIHTMTGNSNSQNTNQMVSDVSALVSNIKGNYTSSTNGYADITTATAIQASLIPTDLKISGGTIVQNQFQAGTIEIAPENTGEAFSITYSAVPSAICNKAIAALAGSAFLTISINGGTPVYDSVNNVEISPSVIAGECSGSTNSITFTAS